LVKKREKLKRYRQQLIDSAKIRCLSFETFWDLIHKSQHKKLLEDHSFPWKWINKK